MEYTITKATFTDKAKDGSALRSKSGNPFYKVGIKVQEFGDTWINGLLNFEPKDWEGTKRELEIYDEEYQGKSYKKFRLPKKEDKVDAKLEQILNKLTGLSLDLMRIEVKLNGKKSSYPEESNETAFDNELDDSTPF